MSGPDWWGKLLGIDQDQPIWHNGPRQSFANDGMVYREVICEVPGVTPKGIWRVLREHPYYHLEYVRDLTPAEESEEKTLQGRKR